MTRRTLPQSNDMQFRRDLAEEIRRERRVLFSMSWHMLKPLAKQREKVAGLESDFKRIFGRPVNESD